MKFKGWDGEKFHEYSLENVGDVVTFFRTTENSFVYVDLLGNATPLLSLEVVNEKL